MDKRALNSVGIMQRMKLKAATAESCTGGMIAKLITDVPGASDVFEYGIVSYSDRIKNRYLGVPEDTLHEFTAVSEQTARAMALGALENSGADIALSTTGYAGPRCGTEPCGLIFACLAAKDGTADVIRLETKSDDRCSNREKAASKALEMLEGYLENTYIKK